MTGYRTAPLSQLLKPEQKPTLAIVREELAERWYLIEVRKGRYAARWEGEETLPVGQVVGVRWDGDTPAIVEPTRSDAMDPVDVEILS
jgi:hypothetical protein